MYVCLCVFSSSSTAQTRTTSLLKPGNGNLSTNTNFTFFFLSFLRFEETSLTYLQDLQATLNPDYVTGLNIRQQLSLLGAGGSLLPDLEATAGS